MCMPHRGGRTVEKCPTGWVKRKWQTCFFLIMLQNGIYTYTMYRYTNVHRHGNIFCCILRKHRRFQEENSRFQARNNSLPMAFAGIVILLPFCTKLLRFALLQVLKGGAMVFLKVGWHPDLTGRFSNCRICRSHEIWRMGFFESWSF